jgi:hypothetical protein
MIMANTDAGKPVVQFTDATLSTIQSFGSLIAAAANASGVSALTIAAPIAREMNKAANGDHDIMGIAAFGIVAHGLANTIADYGDSAPNLARSTGSFQAEPQPR